LLGALGTLGLGGMTLVQAANMPTMPKVADDPPPTKLAAPPSKEPPSAVTPTIPAEPLTAMPQGGGYAPVIDKETWCNDGGGGWGFVAGVEALYLRPQFTSNPAFTQASTTSTTLGPGPGPTAITGNILRTTPEFSY